MSARLQRAPKFTYMLCSIAALTAVPVPMTGIAQETTEDFDRLLAQWNGTPAGARQAIQDSIQALIPRLVGDDAVTAYGEFLRADLEPEEEAAPLDRIREMTTDVRWERARDLLEAYWFFAGDSESSQLPVMGDSGYPSVMGYPHPYLESSQVDITLESTQASATAGGRFAVLGTIINRRDQPVWIVNRYTTLLPPPEISGRGPGGSMPALFPSVRADQADAVVRIDALGSYVVTWHLEPRPASDTTAEAASFDFMQFRPGEYRFTALVHTWPRVPSLTEGRVVSISDSEIVRGEARIQIGLPIMILVVGAIAGGLAAFATRFVGMRLSGQDPSVDRRTFLWVGGVGAIVAPAIGTILLSRLGQMDSFISLSINDLWGAMASGFLLEWLGLRRLLEPLGKVTGPEGPAREDAA